MGTYGTLNFQVYFVISLGRLFVTFANRQGHHVRGPERIHQGGYHRQPRRSVCQYINMNINKMDESSKLP